MKPFTESLKKKIAEYRKNHLDISSLIEDIDIRNQDLSYCIIKYFRRINSDISNCNFAHCILGDETRNKVFSILNSKMNNCNLNGVKFVGPTFIRYSELKNCNIRNADVANVDYQYTDFTGSDFCNSKITISTTLGLGCKFPAKLLYDLTQGWNLKIKVEEQ